MRECVFAYEIVKAAAWTKTQLVQEKRQLMFKESQQNLLIVWALPFYPQCFQAYLHVREPVAYYHSWPGIKTIL